MNGQYRAHFPTRPYGLQRRVAAHPFRQQTYTPDRPRGWRLTLEQIAATVGIVLIVLTFLALMSLQPPVGL